MTVDAALDPSVAGRPRLKLRQLSSPPATADHSQTVPYRVPLKLRALGASTPLRATVASAPGQSSRPVEPLRPDSVPDAVTSPVIPAVSATPDDHASADDPRQITWVCVDRPPCGVRDVPVTFDPVSLLYGADRKKVRVDRTGCDAASGSEIPSDSRSWLEKHRPVRADQFEGNEYIVNRVLSWLASAGDNNVPMGCCIVGKVGCGKSSVAHAIATQHGYEVFEISPSSQLLPSTVGAVIKTTIRTPPLKLSDPNGASAPRLFVVDDLDAFDDAMIVRILTALARYVGRKTQVYRAGDMEIAEKRDANGNVVQFVRRKELSRLRSHCPILVLSGSPLSSYISRTTTRHRDNLWQCFSKNALTMGDTLLRPVMKRVLTNEGVTIHDAAADLVCSDPTKSMRRMLMTLELASHHGTKRAIDVSSVRSVQRILHGTELASVTPSLQSLATVAFSAKPPSYSKERFVADLCSAASVAQPSEISALWDSVANRVGTTKPDAIQRAQSDADFFDMRSWMDLLPDDPWFSVVYPVSCVRPELDGIDDRTNKSRKAFDVSTQHPPQWNRPPHNSNAEREGRARACILRTVQPALDGEAAASIIAAWVSRWWHDPFSAKAHIDREYVHVSADACGGPVDTGRAALRRYFLERRARTATPPPGADDSAPKPAVGVPRTDADPRVYDDDINMAEPDACPLLGASSPSFAANLTSMQKTVREQIVEMLMVEYGFESVLDVLTLLAKYLAKTPIWDEIRETFGAVSKAFEQRSCVLAYHIPAPDANQPRLRIKRFGDIFV